MTGKPREEGKGGEGRGVGRGFWREEIRAFEVVGGEGRTRDKAVMIGERERGSGRCGFDIALLSCPSVSVDLDISIM